MVLSAVTLALCGIVFGVLNVRQAHDLSAQNTSLKEKRIELLGQIRERNREISELRARLDSLPGRAASAPVVRKSVFVFRSDLNVPPETEGIPISFDNGTTQKRLLCLTFDGGDQANAAAEILDTLKSRNVKATMFLTGRFVKRYPDVVSRIISDGHEIGSHTFSHPHLTSFVQDHTQTVLPTVTEAYLRHELVETDSLFQSLFGARLAPLWRAPYGEYNRTICLWAQHAGFLHVGWRQGRTWKLGLDSNDWTPDEETPGYHTPQEVFDKIVGLAQSPGTGINGGIILMHLNTARQQKDRQVHFILGKLIDTLASGGYRFVTVGEMLKESGVDITRLKRL
jgi:peptidoglycan/xylan/chitin deacetylase (PgdA/CDA1 family)